MRAQDAAVEREALAALRASKAEADQEKEIDFTEVPQENGLSRR